MTVANVVKELQGVYGNDQATGEADIQDLVTDDTLCFTTVVDSAAGTDFTHLAWKAPYALRIISVVVCGGALTAADATANTFTLAKDDGAGGASTSVATLVTNLAGGDWVASTYKNFTLSTVAGATSLTDGQRLTLKKTHAGAGTATPQVTWTIRYRKI